MLSQLTKTIKLALKSTEEERAILRARSAVQRFPVVEWRQRMEDFHKRSINASRGIAGANAWREADCDGGGLRPLAETDDWDPVSINHPSQPDWDTRSIDSQRMSGSPMTPGTPGQWGPYDPNAVIDPYLAAPRAFTDSQRNSIDSTDGSDYFSHTRASSQAPSGYGNFLDKANRTIARDQKHAPDPFLDPNSTLMPNRPFGSHSRVSSVESIASIVDEKSNSPLNKAMASVGTLLTLVVYELNCCCYSSLTPTGVSLPSLCKSCRCSARRIPRANYRSSGFWSRAKKPSLAKSARRSSTVPPVFGHLNETLFGVHPHLLSIRGRTVREVLYL
jgi:hypothetical protein